jgi:hypothetical protein
MLLLAPAANPLQGGTGGVSHGPAQFPVVPSSPAHTCTPLPTVARYTAPLLCLLSVRRAADVSTLLCWLVPFSSCRSLRRRFWQPHPTAQKDKGRATMQCTHIRTHAVWMSAPRRASFEHSRGRKKKKGWNMRRGCEARYQNIEGPPAAAGNAKTTQAGERELPERARRD